MSDAIFVVRYADYERERKKEITAIARKNWILRGCPEGSSEVDWFSAELEFDQQFLAGLDFSSPA
jgi:hypothetical protein